MGAMSFRSFSDVLDQDDIPLDTIRSFSLATQESEHDAIAQRVAKEYGLPGLRTLWLCQGLNCSTRTISVAPPEQEGITRATRWWLSSTSAEATAIKNDFASIFDWHDANRLLTLGTRTPEFDTHFPQNNDMFSPRSSEQAASLLHAIHVRRLAQAYFPHVPLLASPFNHLYFASYEVPQHEKDDPQDSEREWNNVYPDPIGAFMDDVHALKFFAASNRPLPLNPPEWLVDFAKNGDTEWNVYKGLGIPMEQAYALAVENAACAKESLALPADMQPQVV